MIRVLDGTSTGLDQLRPFDLYNPNLREFVTRPARFAYDLAAYLPSISLDFARGVPGTPAAIAEPLREFLRRPNYTRFEVLAMRLIEHISPKREVPVDHRPHPGRHLRQQEPRALAAAQPAADQDAERLPRRSRARPASACT
jgi:hypothetical protein